MNQKGMRIAAMVVPFAALFITGVLGIQNATSEWGDVETVLQRFVTFGGGLYGVLGLIAAAGVLMRRGWGLFFTVAWAVVTTMVGTLAVIAYADEGATLGSVAGAFVACVVVTGIVVGLVRFGISRSS